MSRGSAGRIRSMLMRESLGVGASRAVSAPARRLGTEMSTLFDDLPLPGMTPAQARGDVDVRGVPTWAQAGGEPPEDAGRRGGAGCRATPRSCSRASTPSSARPSSTRAARC